MTKEAKDRYSVGLKRLLPLYDAPKETRSDIDSLKLPLYLNIAACQMKFREYHNVINNCTKVLGIENANTKALYRRSLAYTELNEFELAINDAKNGLAVDQNNQAFEKQLFKIERRSKEEKQMYQKMMQHCFTQSNR